MMTPLSSRPCEGCPCATRLVRPCEIWRILIRNRSRTTSTSASTRPRPPPRQQPLHAQVLIHQRPANPLAIPHQLPPPPLLRHRPPQPRKPHQRHADAPPSTSDTVNSSPLTATDAASGPVSTH